MLSTSKRRMLRHSLWLLLLLSTTEAAAGPDLKPDVKNVGVPGTWTTIGRATVDEGKDKDVFKIEDGPNRFRHLRVKAEKADIEVKHMWVFYEDGDKEELEVKSKIKAGSSSKSLDLKGTEKKIKKVEFTYSSSSKKDKKAIAILEGQK